MKEVPELLKSTQHRVPAAIKGGEPAQERGEIRQVGDVEQLAVNSTRRLMKENCLEARSKTFTFALIGIKPSYSSTFRNLIWFSSENTFEFYSSNYQRKLSFAGER